MIDKHLDLLGRRVKDKVTGIKGTVTSVAFDLYGCIQAVVIKKDGNSGWYDIGRLEVSKKNRAMDLPNFEKGYIAEGKKGPAEKPSL